MKEVLKVAI